VNNSWYSIALHYHARSMHDIAMFSYRLIVQALVMAKLFTVVFGLVLSTGLLSNITPVRFKDDYCDK
jgi:uncharacterized membrane protein